MLNWCIFSGQVQSEIAILDTKLGNKMLKFLFRTEKNYYMNVLVYNVEMIDKLADKIAKADKLVVMGELRIKEDYTDAMGYTKYCLNLVASQIQLTSNVPNVSEYLKGKEMMK